MKFEHTIEVRGNELDAFGHVNNAVYLNYYEQARWVMMQELGLLEYFEKSGNFLVVAKADLKFIRELRLLEKVTITSTFRLESFFVVFSQEIRNAAGERVNTASFRCLFVDRNRTPLDIPVQLLKSMK